MRKGREAKKMGEGTILAKFAQVTEQSLSFPSLFFCVLPRICHICLHATTRFDKASLEGKEKGARKNSQREKENPGGNLSPPPPRLPISPVFPFVFYCSGLAPLLLRYLAEVRDSTTMSRGMNFSKEHKKTKIKIAFLFLNSLLL